MNLKTAARRLGVHYQTAYRWVRSGELVAVKVGAGYEVSEAAVARFAARRAAMERLPDDEFTVVAEASDAGTEVIGELAEMVERTTVDASAAYQRAAQALSRVIGDAAIISLREADGSLRLVAFDHPKPERAVLIGAMLRFGALDEPMYARQAADTGEPLLVPQVPQRDVRTQLRPEFHQCLATVGFYSAVTAPIVGDGVVRGTVLTSRDSPGRPYTTEDRDFVVAVADQIGAAIAHAERGHAAWALRGRLGPELAEWVRRGQRERSRDWLAGTVADADAVAIVNLDTTIDAATPAFAALFGTTVEECKERSVCDLVEPARELQHTFERLREGEFDFCSLVVPPASGPVRRAALHGTIVRLPDATPCCALYVAHAVPEVTAASAATFSPR